MSFTPTREQQAIVDATVNTKDNLLITARAGSGKTSSIQLMAEAMKEPKALCLAFNKNIAVEMQERLPSTCTASTLNSLGHRAWGATISKRLQLDTRKNYKLLSAIVNRFSQERRDRFNGDGEGFTNVLQAISRGKRYGFMPSNVKGVSPIITESHFFDCTDAYLNSIQRDVVCRVSRESFKQALNGLIDFDDQILCPTIYNEASFRQYPLTLIDEAQDLSELNHAMLAKVVGKKRIIAVGDDCQAIYAFRGAEEESMSLLKQQFNMTELKLTVSFRCGQDIIRNARDNHPRASDMKWVENAPMGEVLHYKTWTAEESEDAVIEDGMAIICRNNAPLFSCALDMLAAGRKPYLANRNVIMHIVKILESFGNDGMTQVEVFDAIDLWVSKAHETRRDTETINDTAACMSVLAKRAGTLGDAISLANTIDKRSGGVWLSTVHKAKGLEWNKVAILDVHLIDPDRVRQDANVRYVAETRAKNTLMYITSEGYTTILAQEADSDKLA